MPGSNEKATFGFSAICKKAESFAGLAEGSASFHEGQLQWNDHAAGVRFHGDIDSIGLVESPGVAPSKQCEAAEAFVTDPDSGPVVLSGIYRPQSGGPGGQFTMVVTNAGKGGINGDTIEIDLFGGEYIGYTNAGVVEGGQIDIK